MVISLEAFKEKMLRLSLNAGKSLSTLTAKEEFTLTLKLAHERLGSSFQNLDHLERAYDYLMRKRLRGLPQEADWREAISATRVKPVEAAQAIAFTPIESSPWGATTDGLILNYLKGRGWRNQAAIRGLTDDEMKYLADTYQAGRWDDEWARDLLKKHPYRGYT